MPGSVDTYPMGQTPGHILQNAFGDIRVEFIARDLQGGVGMEVVNKGHGGGGCVAQIPRGYSPRKWVGDSGSPGV